MLGCIAHVCGGFTTLTFLLHDNIHNVRVQYEGYDKGETSMQIRTDKIYSLTLSDGSECLVKVANIVVEYNIIATKGHTGPLLTGTSGECGVSIFKGLSPVAVPDEDLPLYVSWKTGAEFERALKGKA
jgi:hypothetical protein